MEKFIRRFLKTKRLLIIAIGMALSLSSVSMIQAITKTISLKDGKLGFTLTKFYISNVADGRVNRSSTGTLVSQTKNQTMHFDLKDGAIFSIKTFLNHNFVKDTLLKPALLTVKKFYLIETKLPNGLVRGDLNINFSFSSQLSYENKHLVDFTRNFSYKRGVNKGYDLEPFLRQGIIEGLRYFNIWSSQRPDQN